MNHESVEAWAGGGPRTAEISGYALDCWSAGNVWTSPFYRQMVCLQRKDGSRLGLVVTLRSGNASCFGRDVNCTVWRIRRQKTYRHVLLSRSPRYSSNLKVGVKKLAQKQNKKKKRSTSWWRILQRSSGSPSSCGHWDHFAANCFGISDRGQPLVRM